MSESENLHDGAVQEEKRKELVSSLVHSWKHSPDPAGKKIWVAITTIMQFVGSYPGFAGADKRKLALDTMYEFLQQTNSPGPDYVVDAAIMWAVEYGVDALYDAFKGKFDFDGRDIAVEDDEDEDEDDYDDDDDYETDEESRL